MRRKVFMLIPAFQLLLSFSLVPLSLEQLHSELAKPVQQGDLKVRNLNSGKSYSTIQEAIDATETLDGHEIFVGTGTYHEHVTVDKSLSLIGEDRATTIIDGDGTGKVVHVTADDVTVGNLTIQDGTFGIWLHNAQNSRITGNTLRQGSYGLRLYHAPNSEIMENSIREYMWFGLEVESSGNSTLKRNTLVENKYNFGVDGSSPFDFINDIDDSNTVNGKPIHYLVNQHNITIDSSTFQEMGYLGLVNSTNIRIRNLNAQDNVQGILLASTTDSTISNVNAKGNWNGIYVAHSTNVSVSMNEANMNFDYGIKFFNSSSSTARDNNVDNNGWAGIGLFKSPNSAIEGNEANFNTYDLHLVFTNNSVIARNSALVKPGACYSIAVYYSHNNLIYHNTFDNRLLYVESRNWKPFTPRNSWDNGIEGNYWSAYRCIDADFDGIGDTPYTVGQNNTDNHPLMGRLSEFHAAFAGEDYGVSIISNLTIFQFHFSPDDGGISFTAAGENEAMGFSRIAIPNELHQQLPSSNLTFLINGEQPALERKWTDETSTYFYLSYGSGAPDLAIHPWLIIAVTVTLVSLMTFVVVVSISRKKRDILDRSLF